MISVFYDLVYIFFILCILLGNYYQLMNGIEYFSGKETIIISLLLLSMLSCHWCSTIDIIVSEKCRFSFFFNLGI